MPRDTTRYQLHRCSIGTSRRSSLPQCRLADVGRGLWATAGGCGLPNGSHFPHGPPFSGCLLDSGALVGQLILLRTALVLHVAVHMSGQNVVRGH